MAEQPQQPEPSPFEQIQAQLNQLTQGLGQFAQSVDQRLNAVAAKAGQPAAPPAPKRPEISLDQANAQLLEQIGTAPVRVFGEAIATAKQEALAEFQRLREQERMEEAQRAQQERFWGEFRYHNADLDPFLPMVWAEWQRHEGIPDPSARANEAAKQVRAVLAQQRADAVEAERRQRAGQRMVSMPPGFPMPQPGAYGEGGEQPARGGDPQERLAEIMAEHNARKAATSWHNIATKDYHRAAQDRAANTRVIRQRVA